MRTADADRDKITSDAATGPRIEWQAAGLACPMELFWRIAWCTRISLSALSQQAPQDMPGMQAQAVKDIWQENSWRLLLLFGFGAESHIIIIHTRTPWRQKGEWTPSSLLHDSLIQ